jgi:hypothetical protein
MGVDGQLDDPADFPPGKTPYPLWVGPRASLKNLAPNGIRSPDRPARSELLFRLSYPGPVTNVEKMRNIYSLSVDFNV